MDFGFIRFNVFVDFFRQLNSADEHPRPISSKLVVADDFTFERADLFVRRYSVEYRIGERGLYVLTEFFDVVRRYRNFVAFLRSFSSIHLTSYLNIFLGICRRRLFLTLLRRLRG